LFAYDAFGFLRAESSPEMNNVLTIYNTYDALGDLLSKTDPGSLTTTLTYDAAGRLTGIVSGGSRYVVNCYDGTGTCVDGSGNFAGGTYPLGKVTKRIGFNPPGYQAASVTENFTYSDPTGGLSQEDTSVSAGPLSTVTSRWNYNSLGLVADYYHPRPSGLFAVATTYDAGFPTAVYANGLPVVKAVAYNPAGGIAAYTTGLGTGDTATTVDEDPSYLPRPSDIYSQPVGGYIHIFDTGSYSYDGAGNIMAMGSDQFSYDLRSRLLSATYGSTTRSYAYDRFGNLTSKAGVGYPVSPTTNRLTSRSYDSRGNLTVDGGSSYFYDNLNRQIQNFDGSARWNYLFDGSDERTVRVDPTGNFISTYRDEAGRVVTEFSGASVSRDNVYLGGLLVASYSNAGVAGNGPVWTFYAGDHLGSPRLLTDAIGNPIETRKYWPYGEAASFESAFQRVRFAGMERDTEATHYYDHARSEDFTLGRFLSPEPVWYGAPLAPQTWNAYSYGYNNPLAFADRDGEIPIPFIIAGVGGIYNGAVDLFEDIGENPDANLGHRIGKFSIGFGAGFAGTLAGEAEALEGQPFLAGAAGSGVASLLDQGANTLAYGREFSVPELAADTLLGGLAGKASARIGVRPGRNPALWKDRPLADYLLRPKVRGRVLRAGAEIAYERVFHSAASPFLGDYSSPVNYYGPGSAYSLPFFSQLPSSFGLYGSQQCTVTPSGSSCGSVQLQSPPL
jgi:RHS repeat-associated protein